jgi:hypothetical protein
MRIGTCADQIRRLDEATEAHPRSVGRWRGVCGLSSTAGMAWNAKRQAPDKSAADGQNWQKLAMANFCVNRAVPSRACRLNRAPVPWLGPLARVASSLSRRSGTRARTSGGWMGPLVVALDRESWPWPTFLESGARPTLQQQKDPPCSARRRALEASFSSLGVGRVGGSLAGVKAGRGALQCESGCADLNALARRSVRRCPVRGSRLRPSAGANGVATPMTARVCRQ